jgi:hypothetical protein
VCRCPVPQLHRKHLSYDASLVRCLPTCNSVSIGNLVLQGSGDPAQVDLAKRLKAGLEGREMVSIIVDDTSSVYVLPHILIPDLQHPARRAPDLHLHPSQPPQQCPWGCIALIHPTASPHLDQQLA